jgi:hypothetical protein
VFGKRNIVFGKIIFGHVAEVADGGAVDDDSFIHKNKLNN